MITCLARRWGAARDAILALAPDLSSAVLEAASAAGDDLGPILASRAGLDPALLAALVMRQDETVDIVLARNLALVLPPQLLETLVSRGRTRSSLARSLLAREDLTAADLAPLYLHAEPARRAWIRTGLAGIASLRGTASLLSRPDPASCNRLVALAAAGEIQAFERALAELLGLGSALGWDLGREQRHELLALALLALGVSEEDSVRVYLTLHETIARSVRAVFHLTQIVRSTPRTTAIHLVEATLGAATALRLARRHVPHLSPGDAARGIPLQGAERRTVQDRSRRAS